MAGDADLGLAVEVVDVDRLLIGAERVDLQLRAHSLQALMGGKSPPPAHLLRGFLT